MICGALAVRAGAQTLPSSSKPRDSSAIYYTLIGELALARQEPRVAALAYVSAATADPGLWPRATGVAVEALQPTVALDAAEHWIAQDPNALEPHLDLAYAALSLYQVAVAADAYRFVIAHYEGGVEAAFAAVEPQLLAAENPYAARQVADRLDGYFPVSAAAKRLQGFAALQASDPAAAARAFRAAIALESATPNAPGSQRRRRALVDALRRARVLSGDVDVPLAEAAAALRRQPTAGNRYDYGILLLAARKSAAARSQMVRLLRDRRYGPDATRIVALLDFQSGHDEAARQRYGELLAGGHYVDEAYYYLGLIADRRHDEIGALRDLARVRHGDEVLPAMLRAASILRKRGAGSTADELLDELLEDEPQRAPQIFAVRAQIDARAGETQRALALISHAVREYPDDPDLAYALASIEEQAGRTDAALATLRAALARRPDDPEALNAYGYTLADHGRQLDEARRLIERALGFAPRDAAIRDSLAWALYRQGRTAAALPIESAAYRDAPGGDIGAHLGEILWQLGQRDRAQRIWANAAEIDPEDRLLQQTRARLTAAAPPAVR